MAKTIPFNVKITIDGQEMIVASVKNLNNLTKEIDISRSSALRFGDAMKSLANQAVTLQGITCALNNISGVLNSLTEESRSFAGAMKAANTMAGKDAAGFEQLKDQVSELSETIPLTRDALANGLYQVVSNGVPEDNWISYLEASSRAAVGGIANLEEVVKVTSTVIKNYGLEWNAAQDIQDKIQLTAKNGVTSFEQLAAALPSVTGQAAQLGVSFTEMLAVMSTLTGVTGNTSEVSTQLASVLTALTKESSKSQKMAEAMGISFNAASIKAAGGLKNYLQELDRTVTAYANKTGQLKESIYSKLFGRAEALRLVNGLTGNLAGKFEENIAALDASAGTIDEAFTGMASTGSSKIQLLKNKWGELTDVIAGGVSAFQPYLTFGSQAGMTIASVVMLTQAFSKLGITAKLSAAYTAASAVALRGYQLAAVTTTAISRALQAAFTGAAVGATTLKVAIRGLLISTGVGAALAALGFVVEKLFFQEKDAAEGADDLTEAQKRLEAQTEAEKVAYSSARVELDKEITKLDDLIKGKKNASAAIKDLNAKYGESFGYHKTASEWYATLTKNSEDYCKQLGYEAKMKVLASQGADIDFDLEKIKRERLKLISENNGKVTYQNKDAFDDLDRRESELKKEKEQNTSDQGILSDLMKSNAAKFKSTTVPSTITPSASEDKDKSNNKNKSTEKTLIANARSYKDLSNNVAYYQQEIEKCNISDTERIITLSKAKKEAENAMKAFTDLIDAESMPKELKSLDDYDKKLSYLRKQRQTANSETISQYDAEIKKTEEARKALEDESVAALKDDEIRTYDELNKKLEYYNRLLNAGDESQRKFAQEGINRLGKLQESWDDSLSAMKLPDSTDNLKDIDSAISFYTDRQQKEDADQIRETQKIIDGLKDKRKVLQLGIDLSSMQQEIEDVNKLSGHELKMKIRGYGFEELTNKIKELQHILNDTKSPVTENQRHEIESMIATYEKWRREAVNSFDSLRNGWDSVKGIGSGIQGVTDALENNGNAWQTITGIIDGFLQIYDGISAIVGIINMITTATQVSTGANVAQAGAITASTAASTADTVVQEAAAAAKLPVIAANKATTASYLELAAAQYMAAHASIPFAGFGIGAGFSTSAAALVQSIGAISAFANGGIVSGPTLGLIGEYAGASHNPEVVAPLDKLRNMIQPAAGVGGTVRFVLEGRQLVGVLSNETRIGSVSGRRTNIRL